MLCLVCYGGLFPIAVPPDQRMVIECGIGQDYYAFGQYAVRHKKRGVKMSSISGIEFTEVSLNEKETFAKWLSSDNWDNFTNPRISFEKAVAWIERGGLHGDDKKTFWIEVESQHKVGLIQLYDLLDSTAMFDIRINTSHRGLGIGRKALSWLTNFAFENYPEITRLEANTRQDNVVMRKVLLSCGYVKEAHYRAGWKTGESPLDWVDSVAYAILRYDWANYTTTPVLWDDENPLRLLEPICRNIEQGIEKRG